MKEQTSDSCAFQRGIFSFLLTWLAQIQFGGFVVSYYMLFYYVLCLSFRNLIFLMRYGKRRDLNGKGGRGEVEIEGRETIFMFYFMRKESMLDKMREFFSCI